MRDSIRQARIEQLQYQIDSISTKNFTINSSSFNSFLLVHNAWNVTLDLDRNGLMVVVYQETGSIVLLSTLPGCTDCHPERSRGGHNRVEIEISGRSYTADSNYTYPITVPDQYYHTAVPNAQGEVLYVLEEQAMDIIEAIVANPAEEITVTASFNDTVYASYTLSDKDKSAIIAAYRLSLLIAELRELEAQNVEWDD